MSEVTLNGSPERPLCEAVKEKPGSSWRPEDVRDVRAMGYLSRKTVKGVEPAQEKKCAAVDKAGRSWRSEERFDIRHGQAEFVVCPAGFPSYFGPVFPFPAFWNSNVYTVPLYVERM